MQDEETTLRPYPTRSGRVPPQPRNRQPSKKQEEQLNQKQVVEIQRLQIRTMGDTEETRSNASDITPAQVTADEGLELFFPDERGSMLKDLDPRECTRDTPISQDGKVYEVQVPELSKWFESETFLVNTTSREIAVVYRTSTEIISAQLQEMPYPQERLTAVLTNDSKFALRGARIAADRQVAEELAQQQEEEENQRQRITCWSLEDRLGKCFQRGRLFTDVCQYFFDRNEDIAANPDGWKSFHIQKMERMKFIWADLAEINAAFKEDNASREKLKLQPWPTPSYEATLDDLEELLPSTIQVRVMTEIAKIEEVMRRKTPSTTTQTTGNNKRNQGTNNSLTTSNTGNTGNTDNTGNMNDTNSAQRRLTVQEICDNRNRMTNNAVQFTDNNMYYSQSTFNDTPQQGAGQQRPNFQRQQSNRTNGGPCYSCKQHGHKSRDCPNRWCENCNNNSHFTRDCRRGAPRYRYCQHGNEYPCTQCNANISGGSLPSNGRQPIGSSTPLQGNNDTNGMTTPPPTPNRVFPTGGTQPPMPVANYNYPPGNGANTNPHTQTFTNPGDMSLQFMQDIYRQHNETMRMMQKGQDNQRECLDRLATAQETTNLQECFRNIKSNDGTDKASVPTWLDEVARACTIARVPLRTGILRKGTGLLTNEIIRKEEDELNREMTEEELRWLIMKKFSNAPTVYSANDGLMEVRQRPDELGRSYYNRWCAEYNRACPNTPLTMQTNPLYAKMLERGLNEKYYEYVHKKMKDKKEHEQNFKTVYDLIIRYENTETKSTGRGINEISESQQDQESYEINAIQQSKPIYKPKPWDKSNNHKKSDFPHSGNGQAGKQPYTPPPKSSVTIETKSTGLTADQVVKMYRILQHPSYSVGSQKYWVDADRWQKGNQRNFGDKNKWSGSDKKDNYNKPVTRSQSNKAEINEISPVSPPSTDTTAYMGDIVHLMDLPSDEFERQMAIPQQDQVSNED